MAAVSLHSKALSAMMTGGMEEASKGQAVMEDVEEPIWERFSQYAYGGDYTPVAPAIDPDSNNHLPLFEPYSLIPPKPIVSGKNKTKMTGNISIPIPPRMRLWDKFCSKTYPISNNKTPPRPNEHSEDYTDVFLCHAKLYIFADKWGVDSLQNLCLHKLQKTLQNFTIYQSRRDDLCRLIDYCYENTCDTDRRNPLRSLVAKYTTCVIEHLADVPRFQHLLEIHNSFSRDLVLRMVKRLDAKEDPIVF